MALNSDNYISTMFRLGSHQKYIFKIKMDGPYEVLFDGQCWTSVAIPSLYYTV